MNTKKYSGTAEKAIKPRGRPKRFHRDDALGQAMSVFCEKGYECASVAQLGSAMNMKPPSLYNAFGDKEQLFIEVLDYYHTPYHDSVREIFEKPQSTTEAIKGLFGLAKAFHTQKNALGCLIVNSAIHVDGKASPLSQKIKTLHDKNEKIIYNRLKRGQKNGDLGQDINIRSLARYVNGVIQGAAVLARGQQSPVAVKDLMDQGFEGFCAIAGLQ